MRVGAWLPGPPSPARTSRTPFLFTSRSSIPPSSAFASIGRPSPAGLPPSDGRASAQGPRKAADVAALLGTHVTPRSLLFAPSWDQHGVATHPSTGTPLSPCPTSDRAKRAMPILGCPRTPAAEQGDSVERPAWFLVAGQGQVPPGAEGQRWQAPSGSDRDRGGVRGASGLHALVSWAMFPRGPVCRQPLFTGDSSTCSGILCEVPEYRSIYRGQGQARHIDPPFNTGQAFEHYDDWMEHNLAVLHAGAAPADPRFLFAPDVRWVHLDDAEQHRMRLLMDEVFGVVPRRQRYPRANDSSSNNAKFAGPQPARGLRSQSSVAPQPPTR